MNKHFRVTSRLREKLVEFGVSVPAVLRRAGLAGDLMDRARILVTTEELFALWRVIGELSSDSTIGLRLGVEARVERFHPSGIAALSTENFGAAVDHMARYKLLTCPEVMLQETTQDEWSIQFRWLLAGEVEPWVLTDYCFAWMQTIGRHGSGTKISPVRVELMQPRAHAKAMERHFGCEVAIGASRNAIVFRAEDARLPFVTRNAELLEMLAPQFDEQIKQQAEPDGFAAMVRAAIQGRLTGHRPVVDDIAKDLHMSSRTLQRRLQDVGSSFQRVLDEARHQMARHYLGNSVLELNEAAYLLGYEDANSFSRAFRGWEGVPPTQWRESRN